MEFRGKVWKTEDRPPWVSEVKSLGVITQGCTKKEALAMLQDAIELYLEHYFDQRPRVKVIDEKGVVGSLVQRKGCCYHFP